MSEPQVCPVCGGEGRVYRMTPSYEAVATQAAGGSFGWTGPTHEWRTCHVCHGSGLIQAAATPPQPSAGLREALDKMSVLRLTGKQLDEIDPDPEKRFFVDWDEYDEFVRLADVLAALAAKPDAGEGLEERL